jgi:hypothetical protein
MTALAKMQPHEVDNLRVEIEHLLNSFSAEGGSDTPDFILAAYLTDCLDAFDKATLARRRWYGGTDDA